MAGFLDQWTPYRPPPVAAPQPGTGPTPAPQPAAGVAPPWTPPQPTSFGSPAPPPVAPAPSYTQTYGSAAPAPSGGSGGGSGAPAAQTGSGATPAMQSLLNLSVPQAPGDPAEGFGTQRQTELAVPGYRSLPASSLALSKLAGSRGRIY